ncbi:hypothetical protein NP233_g6066 [Leucocoprinus birnbaumii]|uniref:DUF6534 domain-containing protein n=1 Tax=Leucocoprinus birnbaumii TaxID=56174 RepID=A0AAD5YRA2_9AGAR|nr:hypothetical protein NP233_g6066 [Leucocoprinus birnbaumii]
MADLPPGGFPPIDLIYGPMLIGVMLNCILFGTYPKDGLWMKVFVVYLGITETINTACDMYLVYQPLIQQFAKVEAITVFPMMLAASPIVTTRAKVSISTPVQMFMAWRIVIITQSRKVPLVIALFSTISFAGAIWVGVNVATLRLFSKKDTFGFNLPGVICLRQRNTGIKRTSSVINRIIKLTIQTGLVTTITALLDLFLFTLSPTTAVSFVWDFSVSKLYTNAFLSTLNARAGWNHLNEQAGDENVLFGSTIANTLTSYVAKSTGNTSSVGSRGVAPLSSSYNSYALKPLPGGVSINVESQTHRSSFEDQDSSQKQFRSL